MIKNDGKPMGCYPKFGWRFNILPGPAAFQSGIHYRKAIEQKDFHCTSAKGGGAHCWTFTSVQVWIF
jgi:hypothetical protein